MARPADYEVGDLDFPVKLKPHTRKCPTCHGAQFVGPIGTQPPECSTCVGTGKLVNGFSVYLTREHLARALGTAKGTAMEWDIPSDMLARRIVLEEGTGQILIRLKRVRE